MKKLLCVLMFGMMFGQAEWTTRVYTTTTINDGYALDVNSLDSDLLNVDSYLLKII